MQRSPLEQSSSFSFFILSAYLPSLGKVKALTRAQNIIGAFCSTKEEPCVGTAPACPKHG